jgi:hypothetical protein
MRVLFVKTSKKLNFEKHLGAALLERPRATVFGIWH